MPRGCGDREDGGLYCCMGLSDSGVPIEHFLLDPPRPWLQGPMRGPMLVNRTVPVAGEPEGMPVKDMVMWVGAEFYPTISDFIEEARRMGISKRIPSTFPVEQLTPGLSRMVLVHSRAINQEAMAELPAFSRYARTWCKRLDSGHPGPDGKPCGCTYDLWAAESAYKHDKRQISQPYVLQVRETPACTACHGSGEADDHGTCKRCGGSGKDYDREADLVDVSYVDIQIPCGQIYRAECHPFGMDWEAEYQPGAFAVFPITHFEFCSRTVDPDEMLDQFAELDWDFRVVQD